MPVDFLRKKEADLVAHTYQNAKLIKATDRYPALICSPEIEHKRPIFLEYAFYLAPEFDQPVDITMLVKVTICLLPKKSEGR
jgi:hypothetical protein